VVGPTGGRSNRRWQMVVIQHHYVRTLLKCTQAVLPCILLTMQTAAGCNPHQVGVCDAGREEHLPPSTDAVAMAVITGRAVCAVVVNDLNCHRGSLPAACKSADTPRTSVWTTHPIACKQDSCLAAAATSHPRCTQEPLATCY
jgi:hypothetical protein